MKRYLYFLLTSLFIFEGYDAISQSPVQTELQKTSGKSNINKNKKAPSAKSIKVADEIKTPPPIDRTSEKILGLPVRNEQSKQLEESSANSQSRSDTAPSVTEVTISKPPSPNIDNAKFPVRYSAEQSTTIVHQPQANGRALKFNKQPHKGMKKKAHRIAVKGKNSQPS